MDPFCASGPDVQKARDSATKDRDLVTVVGNSTALERTFLSFFAKNGAVRGKYRHVLAF
jgi:hypothetical protein